MLKAIDFVNLINFMLLLNYISIFLFDLYVVYNAVYNDKLNDYVAKLYLEFCKNIKCEIRCFDFIKSFNFIKYLLYYFKNICFIVKHLDKNK